MDELISKDYVRYLIDWFQSMLSWSTSDKISEILRKIKEDKEYTFSKYQEYTSKDKVLFLVEYYSSLKCLTEKEIFNNIKEELQNV